MNDKTIFKSLLILVGTVFLLFSAPTVNAQSNSWKAPQIANKLKDPLKNKSLAIREGKKLYNINCTSCHGNLGEGDGIAASGLEPRPTDFTDNTVKKESDGALYWKITKGKPGTSMLGWKSSLTSKERWQIVSYIRKIQSN